LGLALLAVILLRGFQAAILDEYPLFYVQAACVLVGFTLLYIRHERPAGYAQLYWPLQFLTMLVASGVILEILRHALLPLARSRQWARIIRGVLFLAIVCFVGAYAVANLRNSATKETLIVMERGFRAIQALLLFGTGSVIVYQRIPLGRNLKGMFVGYSFYVGTSLIILALRAYMGPGVDPAWDIVQPLSYDIGLIVWAVGLWSYSPPRVPGVNMELETNRGPAGIIRWTAFGSLSQ
jgi:hypothetical protein